MLYNKTVYISTLNLLWYLNNWQSLLLVIVVSILWVRISFNKIATIRGSLCIWCFVSWRLKFRQVKRIILLRLRHVHLLLLPRHDIVPSTLCWIAHKRLRWLWLHTLRVCRLMETILRLLLRIKLLLLCSFVLVVTSASLLWAAASYTTWWLERMERGDVCRWSSILIAATVRLVTAITFVWFNAYQY